MFFDVFQFTSCWMEGDFMGWKLRPWPVDFCPSLTALSLTHPILDLMYNYEISPQVWDSLKRDGGRENFRVRNFTDSVWVYLWCLYQLLSCSCCGGGLEWDLVGMVTPFCSLEKVKEKEAKGVAIVGKSSYAMSISLSLWRGGVH